MFKQNLRVFLTQAHLLFTLYLQIRIYNMYKYTEARKRDNSFLNEQGIKIKKEVIIIIFNL